MLPCAALESYPACFGGISVTVLCTDIRERIQALNANGRAPKLAPGPDTTGCLHSVNDRASVGVGTTATIGDQRGTVCRRSNLQRQHAFTVPASLQLPEPSHAERDIRTLMSLITGCHPVDAITEAPGLSFRFANALRSRFVRAAHLSHQQYGYAYPEPQGRLPMQPLHWPSGGRW